MFNDLLLLKFNLLVKTMFLLSARTKGSLVRSPAGAHFVVALSKSHLPCLVLVEPRKRWTDDRLGQTVTRLEITLCLMC